MKKAIIAIGSLKNRPEKALFDAFYKRLTPPPLIHEIVPKGHATSSQEADLMMTFVQPDDHVISLDEKGATLTTRGFKDYLNQREGSTRRCVFLIGGADGLDEKIKQRANFSLAFGAMTWPHLLVRVLLIEQLYRCQQIDSGHPYHRD
ncbi:23S rRNA (pseudouridine(1915)-N(3))-methyltransferase RlmH [Candidatus Finniella inopinata]|uniref:Ribosomal RNA large subunit methyltransferase H n=1 Tax=Candidatus Finniella inopinata TaxID=1696036 RepID=A0A4V2DZI8_9PROT|nr:23S rRNA (pseudouridine(1915)-N(3))-methyltransferase RlmH [Candidatus Finniella inopinata]RZI45207.1 23S rRNA (pseudouridine(1915)-N(3))-methyltransferase RlmH [Candidatus Finniella inopinata]